MFSFPKVDFNASSFQRTSKKSRRNTSYDASKSGSSRKMTRRAVTCKSTIEASVDQASSTPTSSHRLSHDDRVGRTKQGDKGKGVSKHDPESMSESAWIAHNYRSALNREDQGASRVARVPRSTQLVHPSINASCSTPCSSMCTEAVEPLVVGPPSQRLHDIDMLCSVSPVIVDNRQEEPNPQDILFPYRWTPHNVVFDSHCPEVAPHIVITPPTTGDWLQAAQVADSNRAPQQLYSHLPVPPFCGSTCRMHTYDELMALFYPPQAVQASYYGFHPSSQRVFNRVAFQKWIESTEQERLCCFARRIVSATQRRLFKVAAEAAGLKARGLRARYDTPGFCETFERPYKWVDPIDAILACYPTGVHYIPSPSPFSVPHILIHEAPPNDPSIVAANGTPIQVDDGGDALVVLSSRRPIVTYVNDTQYILDEDSRSSCSISSVESAGPETPMKLQRVTSGYFDEVVGTDEISEFDYSQYAALVASEDFQRPGSPTPDSLPRSKFYIEEDDDELPSIDDEWYASIIDRTQGSS
ncbi:hypothetical protein NLJ89_g6426 [Agrocybe chaxingu]|uniref:Uncharacterized protein n=1 Tax=Agrocybe chaxingu TaxID=84603 RepID=A0A9W8JZ95_9AGAR|nr:hypothetical protein NLJ89_g6426 [Agrocybe chaxingu]